jgi:potassium-dependent mechanosensitive channel
VLKNPEPFVLFLNFAHIGLEFEMRVFVADILNGNIVQNDIRFAVLEAFDEAGIEMPSAPRAQVEAKPPEAAGDPPDTGAGDASVPLPPVAVAASATPAQRTRRKPDPD